MRITEDTPIAMLTVRQLREALGVEQPKEAATKAKEEPDKKFVYGLRGIRELFGVSHPTAQRYKDTILKDAVSQQGRIIVTDVDKALELFKNYKNGKK